MATRSIQLPQAALLVIDVQVGMDAPERPPRNNPDAEDNIARLLSAFRAANQPAFTCATMISIRIHLSRQASQDIRSSPWSLRFQAKR